ncbi:cytosine deaminase [Alkaliphilus serpentinus]|uniref:Cytosine deaminase n=1 Tax=Alkaliphilus serpentinus TaxID=1482731 RepID=A0A833HPL6_9FIRM|nr:cytosine deaminase [Alkaliphilus serpentinus]KAB3531064.1 cytosine deaminase [Alkaliphilus serpentinus]
MIYDLIIKNAKLINYNNLVDIAISNGQFSIIGNNLELPSNQVIDAEGCLVIPPYVQSHVHLDSALTSGEPKYNQRGTLYEGIEIWSERRKSITKEDIITRATEAIRWHIGQGILHLRSHVDISDPNLTAVKALLEVKEKMMPYITLQLVGFPQEGIMDYPKAEELMEEALKLGIDAVGGAPHLEFTREDGIESIRRIFKLAEKYDKLIDIHCDETDDEQSRFLEVVAANAIRRGFHQRVTASHTTAMHSYNNPYAAKVLGLCKKSKINFIANPLSNITLQGRFDTYPKRRGITRVKEISELGINISLGHDNIMDPFYGLGTGNMLQVANMCIHISQLTGFNEIERVFDMITHNGAKTLNIESNYGIEIGKPASLVILDAIDQVDALRRMAVAKTVISKGEVVAETPPLRTTVTINKKTEVVSYRKIQ